MTREEARAKAWADWHRDMKIDDMPPGNPLWDIAFDAGWNACIQKLRADRLVPLSPEAYEENLLQHGIVR